MNVLVIGSGGREHALCWKISQSSLVKELYCLPGNGGTSKVAENINAPISDHPRIADICEQKNVELVVIGPEEPLSKGLANYLRQRGVKVFGPSYAASRLESSKIYAKEIMGRYNVPTGGFRIFNDNDKCVAHLRNISYPAVIKANGLAAGKGVFVCSSFEEARAAATLLLTEEKFGPAGQKIIVEDFLEGEEVSILALTDGERIIPLATSQDHKRVGEADTGENTGGMGAYSPAPVVDERLLEEITEKVLRPTVEGLKSEGIEYRGVLYAGLMISAKKVKVLEFNVRFGDPETQAVLARMKSDIVPYLEGAAKGHLPEQPIEWDTDHAICVVLSSGGYPAQYEKGKEIKGIDEAEKKGALVFHAGTRLEGKKFLSDGGRVLGVVALGEDIRKARDKAYEAAGLVDFEKAYYRRDIAFRAIERLQRTH